MFCCNFLQTICSIFEKEIFSSMMQIEILAVQIQTYFILWNTSRAYTFPILISKLLSGRGATSFINSSTEGLHVAQNG